MQLFGKDLDQEVVVVAEIGVNHEGDVEAAERMITLAHESGADAIKLQSYTPERFASSADQARLERVRRFCLDQAAHERLAEQARRIGATLFSTCVSEDVIPMLAALFPAIKIASGDIDFEVLVRNAVRTGKPVILSTGNADLEEIDRAISWCKEEAAGDIANRIAILHCVAAYPAPVDQANVLSVPFLKQRYGLATGYSNHVLGPEASLAAVALGAQILEVHFTDQREGRQFHDHALSFEPAELTALVNSVANVRNALGQQGKSLQSAELQIRTAMRKGVVAARDLPTGTILTEADLMYARPASEFRAAELPSLVGRKLTTPVPTGQLIPRAGVTSV